MNTSYHDTSGKPSELTRTLLEIWPRGAFHSTSEEGKLERQRKRNVESDQLFAFVGSILCSYADEAKLNREQREKIISGAYRALWEEFDDDGYIYRGT